MKLAFVLTVLAALLSTPAFSLNRTAVKQLAPGVTLTQETQIAPALLVNVLTVDPTVSGIAVAPAVANDSLTHGTGDIRKGRENVTDLVLRKNLVAAVNGDYFPYTGDPLGLGIMNGEIYSEPDCEPDILGRAAIGWTAAGQVLVGIPALTATVRARSGAAFAITGIDRMTSRDNLDDLVLCTPRFGPNSGARGNGTEVVLSGATPLPVAPGNTITATVSAVVTASPDPANLPQGGLILSAPAGGHVAAALAANLHVGDIVTIGLHIDDITPASIGGPAIAWDSARQAIGGGPILLRHGKVVVDSAWEGFDSEFSDLRHARTAVGVQADGKIVIVTVDAASSLSDGIDLVDLATLLRGMGVVDAINLDGGGSTTMAALGETVDYPCGSTAERPVADMLTVSGTVSGPASGDSPPSLTAPEGQLVVGLDYPLTLTVNGVSVPGDRADIVWNGPVGDIGFVTQNGVLHVMHAGHGTIKANVDGAIVSVNVAVAPAQSTPPTSSTPAPAGE
jgi:exopolysaccharide biosynthesis protein